MGTCHCGHAPEEHRDGAECEIEGCDCIHYEDAGDDEMTETPADRKEPTS